LEQSQRGPDRWFIAIDIDGTLVHDDGYLSERVVSEVTRVRELGHEVVIATGRAAANAHPIAHQLGIREGHAVTSNGAVTIRINPAIRLGYEVVDIVTFDPAPVLTKLIDSLPNAHFAVEDTDGSYRFHRPFPNYSLGERNYETPLDDLLSKPVSRVVVLSPDHDTQEFLQLTAEIGLHSVSYSIGYTAWLDIAPDGVDKGSALQRVRDKTAIPHNRTLVIGDGRNDIEMFRWALLGGGYAFAMGQAPDEVKLEASAVTAAVDQDGVAEVLASLEGLAFGLD
jgi:Cof subfamily protein (haloacid dehalogenase superfamily)